MIPRSPFAAALALSLVQGLALAQPATTQPAPKPAAKIDPKAEPKAKAKHDLAVARLVARVASIDLRLVQEPEPEDFEIAERTLSLATDLAPTDAELLRRRIEAAYNASDPAKVLELTGKLVALDPADTVAQLRLITAGINRKQTAGERLALFDAFTGPKATALDASVRSRLALDAALLCRETGDHKAFRKFLTLAATLDVTNKEAAMLALQTFQAENPGDVKGRFELLLNLLMADPFDGMVHLTIAKELAAHGVFEHAERAHRNGLRIIGKSRADIPNSAGEETLVLNWQKNGPKSVLDQLNKDLNTQRENIRRYNENVRDTGIGIGRDFGKPEDLRLPPETEKIRLATAIASDDAEAIRASLDDMTRQTTEMFELANDDKKRPFGMTKEEANARAAGSLLDLQFWRVMANLDVDKVEADVAKYEAEHGTTEGPDLVRAVLAIRQNKIEEGLSALNGVEKDLESGSPIFSTLQFIRGLAAEALGQKEQALTAFRAASHAVPMLPVGALARSRIELISGKSEIFSEHQTALARLAAQIPEWIDKAVNDPKTFLTLLADTGPSGDAFAGESIRITLRNLAPIPLALGTDRPINTRFLVAPLLSGRAGLVGREARSEVIEGDRRLRLMPRETLTIDATPGIGFSGYLTELMCDEQLRLNWKVVQGFISTQSGSYVVGPNCLVADTSASTRPLVPDAKRDAATLAGDIADQHGPSLHAWLLAANRLLNAPEIARLRSAASTSSTTPATTPATTPGATPATTPTTPASGGATPATPIAEKASTASADAEIVAKALVERYPALTPGDRLLVAALAPHRGQFAAFKDLDAMIVADADTAVKALGLLTRVREADDPVLAAAAQSADARVKRLAELLSLRLASGAGAYSRLGPGLLELRGDPPDTP